MPECILSRTTNFYKLYQHICGKSEVPAIFNFWCCVSILSAAMEDRFTCELYKGIPLKPNLYIGLIGPGSCGKGLAISMAMQLLESATDINIYRGRVTFAHLIDRMGKSERGNSENNFISNPRMFLVMDELKNGVGANKVMVDEFVSLMTEAYTATHYPLRTGNRTSGEVIIKNPCLNWLFGSTPVWLRKVLTKDVYESGFVARTQFVESQYHPDCRIPRIFYPKDYEIVYQHLKDRLWAITQMNGKFILPPEAEDTFDVWYYNRPLPDDEMTYSIWKRQKEMVIRFSMINCMAEFNGLEIRPKHINSAIYMANQLFRFSEDILEAANENWDTKPTNEVAQRIKSLGSVTHSKLLRYMHTKRGYTGVKLKAAINNLRDQKKIELEITKTGGILYRWCKNS
jgi:hypothetical protein